MSQSVRRARTAASNWSSDIDALYLSSFIRAMTSASSHA
jgi:hypothetical protein